MLLYIIAAFLGLLATIGFMTIVIKNETIPTGVAVRYLAWSSLILILALLFVDALGGPLDLSEYGVPQPDENHAGEPNLLIGIILITTGLMILIETVFTRQIPEFSDWRTLNFFLGLPSAIVAIVIGFSWLVGYETLIVIVGPMLDGVYMGGLIILLYEGIMSLTGGN